MVELYFSKNILHTHFLFSCFSLLPFPFLTHPSILSFLFIFLFFSLFVYFFYFLLFVHLFLFILYGKVCDPRINSHILLCVMEIILMNFLVHKLNEFEQLIFIFKYIEYLIDFINLDLI